MYVLIKILPTLSLTKSITIFDDADIFQSRFYCYDFIITINCNTTYFIIITIIITTTTNTTTTTTTTNLLSFYILLYNHYNTITFTTTFIITTFETIRDDKRR